MDTFTPGNIVTAYDTSRSEMIVGGVLEISGTGAHILLPNGEVATSPVRALKPMYIWPRADLRPGDRVLDPIDYPDHHEVLTVGDMTEVRHCESGGLRFFAPGVLLAVAHRTDLRDLYADFGLPAPKPGRMESLF